MSGKRVTVEELTNIRKLLEEGYKIEYVARKFNRTPVTVYKHLDSKYKRTYKKWTAAEKERAKELKVQGVSVSEIARILGRNRVTLINMFFQERKKGAQDI